MWPWAWYGLTSCGESMLCFADVIVRPFVELPSSKVRLISTVEPADFYDFAATLAG